MNITIYTFPAIFFMLLPPAETQSLITNLNLLNITTIALSQYSPRATYISHVYTCNSQHQHTRREYISIYRFENALQRANPQAVRAQLFHAQFASEPFHLRNSNTARARV